MDVIRVLCGIYWLTSVVSGSLYNATDENLDSVPVDIPANVTWIILRKNRISDLGSGQFADFPRLGSVELDDNQIVNISEFAFCNNATSKITLSRNDIHQFPDLSCLGSVLEKLDLSFNELAGLSERSFTDLTALQELSLYGNKITSASVEALLPLSGTLVILDLSYNLVQDIGVVFQNFSVLRKLSLSGNDIRIISNDAFLNCSSLETLYLRTCSLIQFPVFVGGSHLNRLNLADNNITNVTTGHLDLLPELEHLILRDNKLGATAEAIFRWSNRSHLLTLNLANTGVDPAVTREATFDGFAQLRSLYLGRLNLTTFPNLTAVAGTLRLLDLGYNHIRRVDPERVASLDLLTLVIDKNDFRSWTDIEGIRNLSETLTSLSLQKIRFNDSASWIWQMAALKSLDLQGSALGCLEQPPENTTVKKIYLLDAEISCYCSCWLFEKTVRVVGDLTSVSCSDTDTAQSVDDMKTSCQSTLTNTTQATTWLTDTTLAGGDGYLQWDSWLPWTACSRTCDTGTKFRIKVCSASGSNCSHSLWITTRNIVIGYDVAYSDCQTDPCPEDGVWSQWSDWSACRVTCGSGVQIRTRVCVGPFYGGKPCSSDSVNDVRDCTTGVDCPEGESQRQYANVEVVYTTSDERPVAKGIGSVAVIVVLSVGVILLACDLPTIRRHAAVCIQNVKQKRRRRRKIKP